MHNGTSMMKQLLFIFFLLTVSSFCVFGQVSFTKELNHFLSDSSVKLGHAGIAVYDINAKKEILTYQSDHYFIPASTAKLFTLFAGIRYLGDSLCGLLYHEEKDSLYILPVGDPSFLSTDFLTHPVDEFLRKNKKPVVVFYPDSALNKYGTGWTFDDKDAIYASERNCFPVYKNLLTIKRKRNEYGEYATTTEPTLDYQITCLYDSLINEATAIKNEVTHTITIVSKPSDTTSSFIIPFETNGINTTCSILEKRYGTHFGINHSKASFQWDTLFSQPTDSLFRLMMHRSDNMYAEQTLLMSSFVKLGIISDQKIIDTLLKSDFKDLPQKPRWVDGSGLSRYNLFSPKDMIHILLRLQSEFGLQRMQTILPTGGAGTLKNYFLNNKGNVFAKTGSLSNNVSLCGYMETKSGKTLAFSIMVNNHPGSSKNIRIAMETLLNQIMDRY